MSTDLTLDALDIISLYGFRFKIEHMFRQAVRQVGSLSYHFWMMDMTSLRYRNGNQYLHRKSERYANKSATRFMPTIPLSKLASSPMACYSTSRPSFRNRFGARSDRGSEPFVQAFRHRNLLSEKRCTTRFPIFS
jgi:hypothetical protein